MSAADEAPGRRCHTAFDSACAKVKNFRDFEDGPSIAFFVAAPKEDFDMNVFRSRLMVGSLMLALAAGCSSPGGGGDTTSDGGQKSDGGDKTDGGGDEKLTGDEVLSTLLDAYCETVIRCGEAPFGDVATCKAFVGADPSVSVGSAPAISASFDAGKTTTTPEKLAACAEALKNLPCDMEFQGDFRSLPACNTAFTGTVADGSACISDLACASGSFCFEDNMSEDECVATCEKVGVKCRRDRDCSGGKFCEDGTCAAPQVQPGMDGDDCSQGQRCGPGLVCIHGQDENKQDYEKCGAPQGDGGFCGRDGECASGYRCDYSGYPGVCANPPAKQKEGEPCDPGESNKCDTGLVCVPANDLQSAACAKPKALGESCTKTFECGGLFSLNACDATSKKCAPRPSTGACVAPIPSLGCNMLDAWCDVSAQPQPTCKPFKAANATCNDDVECGSFTGSAWCDQPNGPSMPGTCKSQQTTVCAP
jgi:hypothetical protein